MSNNNKIKNDQSMDAINPQSSMVIITEINNLIYLIKIIMIVKKENIQLIINQKKYYHIF